MRKSTAFPFGHSRKQVLPTVSREPVGLVPPGCGVSQTEGGHSDTHALHSTANRFPQHALQPDDLVAKVEAKDSNQANQESLLDVGEEEGSEKGPGASGGNL